MRAVCISLLLTAATGNAAPPSYKMAWAEFKAKYGKSYTEGEEEARFAIFRQNVDLVHETNKQNLSFRLGVNEWADLTGDEFADIYLTGLQRPSQIWGDLPYLGRQERTGKPLADSVDWTSKGAVTPVKNQKQCGSCWAFSTTGALEGAWEIHTGKLVSLSEQELVDCDMVDQGCHGGLMDHGFQFAEKNNMCTEESYPYVGRRGECKVSSCEVGIPKGAVKGFKDVDVDDQEALKEAVAQQPVSIAIEADKTVFQLYHSGVLRGTCGQRLDHGVLAVGYGTTTDGVDYWQVKNSWGPSWGEAGYIQVLRGKGGKGECGILSGPPSYPVVDGSAPPSPSPPSPSPPSPGPSSTHYEKPPCRSDEVEASVQGSGGELCAPECTAGSCPADVPVGTKAKPACMLQDSSSGKKYCGLECILPGSCPTGASCARIGGVVGVCVYPQTEEKPEKVLEFARRSDATINI